MYGIHTLMFIHRKHITPIGFKKHIYNLYEIYITDNNLVPTTCQMDRAIRSFWRKEDLWFEREYLVPVPSYKHILEATQSDSMDQYWKDIQPSKKKKVNCTKTIKNGYCAICMDNNGPTIALQSCKCVFHYKCIRRWSQYSSECPICKTPI